MDIAGVLRRWRGRRLLNAGSEDLWKQQGSAPARILGKAQGDVGEYVPEVVGASRSPHSIHQLPLRMHATHDQHQYTVAPGGYQTVPTQLHSDALGIMQGDHQHTLLTSCHGSLHASGQPVLEQTYMMV